MRLSFLLLAFLFTCAACVTEPEEAPTTNSSIGLRPLYVPENEATSIVAASAQPILNLGKIYYKDQTIYVNESNFGVHIIDNTDPTNPVKTGFLRIPGCHDIAIKDDILYADNMGDLIAIDISDPTQPKVVKRLPGLQGQANLKYPQFYEGYFECVDETKGAVVGWEKVTLNDPKCWR